MLDDKLQIAPCHKFLNLVVVDKINMSMNSTLQIREVICPPDKFVLVEAAPGMGKSALSLELCRNWDIFPNLQSFKLVLLLGLREPRVQKMSSLNDVFFHDDNSLCSSVVQNVLKDEGKDVLFIFDGYDEIPESLYESTDCFLCRLISGECLPRASRLVTSRPSVVYKLKPQLPFTYKHVEILGFDNKSKIELAKLAFQSKPDRASRLVTSRPSVVYKLKPQLPSTYKHVEILGFDNKSEIELAKLAFQSKPDSLLSQFKDLIIFNPMIGMIMDIPVNCSIIVSLFEDLLRDIELLRDRELPSTMTKLFSLLTVALIRRHKIRSKEWKVEEGNFEFNQVVDKVGDSFINICELAFSTLFFPQQSWVVPEQWCPDDLGLMVATKEMYVTKGVQTTYSFFHRIFQAFLAACCAVNSDQFDYFEIIKTTRRYDEPFLLFYCGLSKPNKLSGLFHKNYDVSFLPQHVILQCVYESQNPTIVSLATNIVELRTNWDLHMLGHLLVHFDHKWRIELALFNKSLAPMLASIQYNLKGNGRLKGSIYHITSYSETLKDIAMLLPDSLVHQISSLKIWPHDKIAENVINSLSKNLIKVELSINPVIEEFRKGNRTDGLETLASLPNLQEVNLQIMCLCQRHFSKVITLLKKTSLKKVELYLLNGPILRVSFDRQGCTTFPSIIHALFTSNSIESVTINFDLDIAARYFASTQVKELTYITTKVCNTIPYVNHALKVNPQFKFNIGSTVCKCRCISSLAKAYRKNYGILPPKSKTEPTNSGNALVFPSRFDLPEEDQFSWGPELNVMPCTKSGRRRSCPEFLYLDTVSNIPYEIHERATIKEVF